MPAKQRLSAGRAQISMLPDQRRAHFHDGPIDLIIEADGPAEAIRQAYENAAERFGSVLDELCDELCILRAPVSTFGAVPSGRIARRMRAAVLPYADLYITPMAAVAGSVAQEILSVVAASDGISRAYVNNGGDIAVHLSRGTDYTIALVDDPRHPSSTGRINISSTSAVRGIATSGRHGRSFSLGIADAVTVLAQTAAEADAAATIIANAVDIPEHPQIQRIPAREIRPDSDLKDIPVTVDVGALSVTDVARALDRGLTCARRLAADGLIEAAALRLRGEIRLAARNDCASFTFNPLAPKERPLIALVHPTNRN